MMRHSDFCRKLLALLPWLLVHQSLGSEPIEAAQKIAIVVSTDQFEDARVTRQQYIKNSTHEIESVFKFLGYNTYRFSQGAFDNSLAEEIGHQEVTSAFRKATETVVYFNGIVNQPNPTGPLSIVCEASRLDVEDSHLSFNKFSESLRHTGIQPTAVFGQFQACSENVSLQDLHKRFRECFSGHPVVITSLCNLGVPRLDPVRRRTPFDYQIKRLLTGRGHSDVYQEKTISWFQLVSVLQQELSADASRLNWKPIEMEVDFGEFGERPICLLKQGNEDWPEYQGKNRDNIVSRDEYDLDWETRPPKLLWRYRQCGAGYSGPSIVGDRVYIGARRGAEEFITCLSALTGGELWCSPIGSTHDPACCCDAGPRSTPTVAGTKVFGMSSGGVITCISAIDGSQIWQRDVRDFGGRVPDFGNAESLLVAENLVFCTPGGEPGAIVALDIESGKLSWQSKEVTAPARYSSPIKFRIGSGETLIAQLLLGQLIVFNAKGDVLHSIVAKEATEYQATNPKFVPPNQLYIIGQSGNALFQFGSDASVLTEIFSYPKPSTYFHGAIVLGDSVYASHGQIYKHSLKTGKVVSISPGERVVASISGSRSNIFSASQSEKSPEILVSCRDVNQPSVSVKSFAISERSKNFGTPNYRGVTAAPVIANGNLYVRDYEILHCYQLAEAQRK